MAVEEHVRVVLGGGETIREWRAEHSHERLDLRGAQLRRAKLTDTDLDDAQLQGANLEWADLRWADLRRADLSHARLVRADLHKAELADANLQAADLRMANLEDADLQGANLTDAILGHTRLLNTDLTGAHGLASAHHSAPSEVDSHTVAKGGRSLARVVRQMFELLTGDPGPMKEPTNSGQEPEHAGQLTLFISHSSIDIEFVEALVDLLRTALRLGAHEIRCTGLDGYRLPAGAQTNEQLRQEVYTARVLVGVLSTDSLKSTYVVFELGARWGAGKYMVPLLTGGVSPRALSGPLASLNALRCTEPQLQQLVGDIARVLEKSPEEPQVYYKHVQAVVARAKKRVLQPEQRNDDLQELDPTERQIVALFGEKRIQELTVGKVASSINVTPTRAKYHLVELAETHKLLNRYQNLNPAIDDRFTLNQDGRRYLVKGGLI